MNAVNTMLLQAFLDDTYGVHISWYAEMPVIARDLYILARARDRMAARRSFAVRYAHHGSLKRFLYSRQKGT